MADWNSLLDDPVFNMGLGLLGGAATPNPWTAATDQLNRYQALRQNREYQQMHAKVYEAQARKAEEEGQARQARQQTLTQVRSTITDPRELQLFDIDPEAWVKSRIETRLKPMVVGRALIDPSKPEKPLYRDPDKPEPMPDFVQMAQMLRDPNVPSETKQLIAQRLRVMSTHAPAPTAISYGSPIPMLNESTGKVEYVQPSNRAGAPAQPIPGYTQAPPAPPALKEPTFDEKKAAGFLGRMERAETILQDPKLQADQVLPLGEAVLRGTPLTGGKLAPYGMSENRQQVRQAQEDWVRAKLRPESGAAIPNDEMEREIQLYFPQPGETNPAIIQQKAQARRQAVEQMRSMAGRASVPANVDAVPAAANKTVVRRVRLKNGKIGIEYSDGTRSVE